jgi:hypothetical protein
MGTSKDSGNPLVNNVLGVSGLSGKSVTGVSAFVHGSIIVIKITHSTGSQYIKVNGLQVEVGGEHEWGSGTKVIS